MDELSETERERDRKQKKWVKIKTLYKVKRIDVILHVTSLVASFFFLPFLSAFFLLFKLSGCVQVAVVAVCLSFRNIHSGRKKRSFIK